jgi:hypothetical protein
MRGRRESGRGRGRRRETSREEQEEKMFDATRREGEESGREEEGKEGGGRSTNLESRETTSARFKLTSPQKFSRKILESLTPVIS